MKRKRFSVEQIVAVVKQAELGLPVADLVRQIGISEQTFYRSKKQYAGLESSQVREFKQLSEENARLKKLVAELSLDKAVLQDVLSRKLPGLPRQTPAKSTLHFADGRWKFREPRDKFGSGFIVDSRNLGPFAECHLSSVAPKGAN